jgi:hypothetical protein
VIHRAHKFLGRLRPCSPGRRKEKRPCSDSPFGSGPSRRFHQLKLSPASVPNVLALVRSTVAKLRTRAVSHLFNSLLLFGRSRLTRFRHMFHTLNGQLLRSSSLCAHGRTRRTRTRGRSSDLDLMSDVCTELFCVALKLVSCSRFICKRVVSI